MQQKASAYVGGEQQGAENTGTNHKKRAQNNTDIPHKDSVHKKDGREETEETQQDKSDSTFILIILLILLSQGETDDKLLLALLYLLF